MKSRLLSFLGIGAITLAVACNSAGDESDNTDSLSTDAAVTGATGANAANVQTASDGRRYILRKRTSSTSTSSTSGGTATSGSDYDTVWVYMGAGDRYYTLDMGGRDTLYFDTDDWNTWWNNPETDNELKSKSGNTKVKVDDDGSWKVKDDTSKTKMNEDGKVKTKPRN